MSGRYNSWAKTIILADHGDESFNVFAHMLRKELKFVSCMKDINSNDILSAYDLTDTGFDYFDDYFRYYEIRRFYKMRRGEGTSF